MNKDNYYKALVSIANRQGIARPFWNSTWFGVKLELKALPKYLSKGERIYSLVPCRYRRKKALAVVTDLRVLVLNRGLLGDFGNTQREDIYYNSVAGGNPHGGLISSYTISVPGAGNDFNIEGLWFRDAKVFDETFNQARRDFLKRDSDSRGLNSSSITGGDPESSEKLDQIRTILQLKKDGDISSEEMEELIGEILN